MRLVFRFMLAGPILLLSGIMASSPRAADIEVCSGNLPSPIVWGVAVDRLVQCNLDVRLASIAVAGARAERVISGQIPNPQASFGAGSINTQKGIRGGHQDYQIDWLARIDQLIERGGKRSLRIAQSESGLLASRWMAAEARRTSLLALSHAWSELWASRQREVLLESALVDFRRIEEVSRIRFDAGDIAQADYSRVVIDLQRIENEQAQARADRLRVQQILAFLLSLDGPPADLAISGPWPALFAGFTEVDTVSMRPEIAAARAQVEQFKSARELARSLTTRDVSVGFQANRFPAPAGDGNTIGLYVSVPLYAWHRHEGELAKAEADVTAALTHLQQLEQQGQIQNAAILQEREIAWTRWKRLREHALPLGERLSSSIRLAYEQRAISLLDMLDSLRVYRLLQSDVLEAQLQYEKSDAVARALLRISPRANDPVFRFVSVPENQP